MLRTLRVRLAFSHALPVLVLVPLLGLALLYQIERHYFLESLASELAVQGALVAEFTQEEQALWQDSGVAQAMLQQLAHRIPARIMLFDGQGRLLASSLPSGSSHTGQVIENPLVQSALQGQPQWEIDYSATLGKQVIDVFVPVLNPQGQVIGLVRLSHILTEIQARLVPLRWLILMTLLIGGAISLLLGLFLAHSLAFPLTQLTRTVARFSPGVAPEPVPENGPEEIRTLATAFNRMGQRLYTLELNRRRLLSGIVHEIGRPLGSIKLAAQAISQGVDGKTAVELADGIDEQVDQLRLGVDDLTLLGQVETQELALHRDEIDVAALVRRQCRQFLTLARQKGLDFDCDLPRETPPICADPQRLGQILGNLLHNAYKYTPAGGQVRLAVEIEGEDTHRDLIVKVTDTGPGIDPREREKIFDLFYRSPGQHCQQGMGIGLALARHLAEAHGGSLTVEGQPGLGATFILCLPVEVFGRPETKPAQLRGPSFSLSS
jgi:two-component system sensor histidine kinase BaeS